MTETTNIPVSDPVQQTMEHPDKRMPPADHKRLLLVAACLFMLIAAGVLVRWKQQKELPRDLTPAPEVAVTDEIPSGQYYVEPSTTDVANGDTITLAVYFDAESKVLDGADAVLTFDPNYFSVSEVVKDEENGYFEQIPRATVDNTTGRIQITGFSPRNETPISQPVLFFQANLQARKAGETRVDFLFSADSTNQSTLVERGTSKNILGATQGVTFTISE